MSKKLTKTTTTETALTVAPEMAAWGCENIDRSDILIPKLLLMQGQSKYVQDEKAAIGDIVNSVTGKVLGGKTKPVRIVPLMAAPKTFELFEAATNKFISVETVTPANVHLAARWDDELNGVKVKRVQCLNFYVMIADEIADPEAIPYLLKFKSTGYKVGKKLVTHFAQSQLAKLPPAHLSFHLSSTKEANDDGTYYVWDVSSATKITQAELAICFVWYKQISKGHVQVDTSDEEHTATPTKERAVDTSVEAMF